MRMQVYARHRRFRSLLGRSIRRPPAGSDPLLLDLRRFPDAVPQVVELGPPDIASSDDLDLGEDRRVHRERALDTDPEADLADSERLAGTAPLATDHCALKELDPLPGAFDHANVHLQGVARSEV